MKTIITTLAVLVATGMAGCGRELPPDATQIEALAMAVAQRGATGAEHALRQLAERGSAVAQRELGILYRARPDRRSEAMTLLRNAALANDAQAAFHLGELYRTSHDNAAGPAAAWPWYQRAAEGGQAKAALRLGIMARNGEGVPRDAATAARWLQLASDLGNPHAMFLLSYAYRDGDGVPADPQRARVLLEESAEREYPPALQELALTVDDPQRASHLMKDATGHWHNDWNRF